MRGDMIALLPKTPQVVSTSQVEKNQWQSLQGGALGSLQRRRAAWPPLQGAAALGAFCQDTSCKMKMVEGLWVIFPFLIKCVHFRNKT